mmetsp:Transcript_24225/g.76824  ORF Transcript_24225/g.76824 Transcript_24225/m.76824 type:complete len:307 (-) Transcript_24225:148-1068(-)
MPGFTWKAHQSNSTSRPGASSFASCLNRAAMAQGSSYAKMHIAGRPSAASAATPRATPETLTSQLTLPGPNAKYPSPARSSRIAATSLGASTLWSSPPTSPSQTCSHGQRLRQKSRLSPCSRSISRGSGAGPISLRRMCSSAANSGSRTLQAMGGIFTTPSAAFAARSSSRSPCSAPCTTAASSCARPSGPAWNPRLSSTGTCSGSSRSRRRVICSQRTRSTHESGSLMERWSTARAPFSVRASERSPSLVTSSVAVARMKAMSPGGIMVAPCGKVRAVFSPLVTEAATANAQTRGSLPLSFRPWT